MRQPAVVAGLNNIAFSSFMKAEANRQPTFTNTEKDIRKNTGGPRQFTIQNLSFFGLFSQVRKNRTWRQADIRSCRTWAAQNSLKLQTASQLPTSWTSLRSAPAPTAAQAMSNINK